MRTLRIPYHLSLALGTLIFGVALTAHAQLGATGRAANASQGDVVHHAPGGLVLYHETTDANGITVREYVDLSGKVYAVSWRGPAMPNVQALLGEYFDAFQQGANTAIGEAGLHTTRVASGDLLVENRVRLREFTGRAWLASALPPGVSAADIH
jgi:hypothetical protein